MGDNFIIYFLSIATMVIFFAFFHLKGNIQTYLLIVLLFFPFMNFLIVKEAYGGFKIFDVISFYCLLFHIHRLSANPAQKRNSFYVVLFVLLFVTILFGSLISEFPGTSIINTIKTIPIFIYCRFLIFECIKAPDFQQKIIRVLKLLFTFSLLFLAIQVLVGIRFTFYPVLNVNAYDPINETIRYPGFFFDSQAEGQYFAMGSFLFLYSTVRQRYKWVDYLLFLGCVAAVFISGSRSAMGGLCVGLFISIMFGPKNFRLFSLSLMTVGLLCYFAFMPEYTLIKRSKNLGEDYQFRHSLWLEALDISKNFPVLGIGNGNYQNYVTVHNPDQYLILNDEVVYFDQPENGYLKVLVELGVTGFVLFLLFVLTPVIKKLKDILTNLVDNKVVFLIASVFSWLTAFNTVYSLFDYRILIMMATILVLVIAHPAKEKINYEAA